MLPTRDEILRATPAGEVLKCLGRSLRQDEGEYYHKSVPSTRISSFYSHSWHGPTWAKILTLMLLNNGSAAVLLSLASVLLVGLLYGLGALPPFPLGWGCVVVGAFVYYLALAFWHRRHLVFVDRICISQSDEQLKGEALISLGAFLKCSDSMLVLWDPSYVGRLWCIFELAGFLHSRQRGMKPQLMIRPTVLGIAVHLILAQLNITNFAASFFFDLVGAGMEFWIGHFVGATAVMLVVIHIGRGYARQVAKVHDDMAVFSLGNLKSFCCSVDHRDPISGESMPCDRKIIIECICTWFGSVHNFEDRVRSEVLQNLIDQLSNEVFSFWQAAVLSAPVFWRYTDLAFQWMLVGDASRTVHNFMRGFTYWLAMSSTLVLIYIRMVYWTRRKRSCLLLDLLTSYLVVLVGAAYFFSHAALDIFLFEVAFPEMRIVAGLTFAVPAFSIALLVWRTIPKIPVHSKETTS
ncbi:UGT80B1 [Symbiodinium sp. KB8]|nr:UGT80B1 [Symbiodinium sp. KB8]